MSKSKYVTRKQIRQKLARLRRKEILPERLIDGLRERLFSRRFTAKQIRAIIKEVEKAYDKSLVEPGEAVGAVAAQSIGEPGTQMSLPGNEQVIIRQGKSVNIVKIGDFVDDFLTRSGETMLSSKTPNSQVADIPEDLGLFVPALGFDESIHWKRLVQISRHLPGGELLKIATRSGRKITATLSHSFVIRKNNTITPTMGRNLRIGDRIPVVRTLPSEKPLKSLKIETYLPANEIWFGSELEKVAKIREESGREWLQNLDSISVPVGIDGLRIAVDSAKTEALVPGYVYPKYHHRSHTKIPEVLPLDSHTGWFIGAYLAEGTNSGTFLSISNVDEAYRKRVAVFADKLGINHHTTTNDGPYGPSITIHLHSTLLAKLFERMCGKGAQNKQLPPWAINCTDSFVSNLLRAYFDGDGNVNFDKSEIRASTSSKKLRDGLCLLLPRFGIHTTKSVSTDEDGQRQFLLRIPGKYALQFSDMINFDIESKRSALEQLVKKEERNSQQGTKTYDIVDMIPGFGEILKELMVKLDVPRKSSLAASIRKFSKKQLISRQTLGRYIEKFSKFARQKNIDIDDELAILHRAYQSGVLWDEITKLELVQSPTEYVYDFTVDEFETFVTAEGIVTHNTLKTFHFAGVAEFNVTLGLPRLIEIVDARRNPSTPTMNVFLDEKYRAKEALAREVAQSIEQTHVERVAQSVEIDLAEGGIVIELDSALLENKGVTPEIVAEKLDKVRPNVGEVVQKKQRIIVTPPLREGEEAVHMAKLQKTFKKVRKALIKGQDGVKRVLIKKEENEMVLYTEGTNLKGTLRTKGVDTTRTVSNHIHEIADTLGIEAARQVIINEAKGVLDEQGLDVDIRHIMLVADLMTATGEIRQIGRHGISGQQSSVLARAAFEVTVRHLIQASVIGEEDYLRGITENVILGQNVPLGTGAIDLFMTPTKSKKG